MDNYLNSFWEMISLRGLTDRTINCAISQLRFLPCMSFTNRGMIPSFLCADLTNIFPLSLPNRKFPSLLIPMPDLKQKAMVALMYSSGLRIGEVCHLRYEDIQRKNMRIHIRHGKNRSDRYAILSKRALDVLFIPPHCHYQLTHCLCYGK